METKILQQIARKNPSNMTREEVLTIYIANCSRDYSDAEKAKEVAKQMTDDFIRARERRESNKKNYRMLLESLRTEIARATDDPENYSMLH